MTSQSDNSLADNRLVCATRVLRDQCARGIAPYITAGDGGLACTLEVLHALDRGGAHCVELGLPFSDPIADGPVLQAASTRALAAGTSLTGTLEMLRAFRQAGGRVPIALMSYANPLMRHGLSETALRVAQAGADALIVPDIPLEEGALLEQACAEAALCPIFFAAPTSNDDRIIQAGARSRGFLYVVGRVGVTGGGTTFDSETQTFLARARALSAAPIAVGFGIATAADVRAAVEHADLAIVGTALVRHLHACGSNPGERAAAASAFLAELQTGLS
ncbi:MAG: tryptophan synthase subunit alpha [Planctomycetota bacterium]|nr:tryptophan synthase subunit alpha [Planctomycetota bacterium]MDP6838368.1 tryptophan synthase subunit alpha [Planctomycetota bacterium]MDP6955727.1 tryptophan synthase subunit alpha [Planctomycetota bacterium]